MSARKVVHFSQDNVYYDDQYKDTMTNVYTNFLDADTSPTISEAFLGYLREDESSVDSAFLTLDPDLPWSLGTFSDVYKGTFQEMDVAVKVLRTGSKAAAAASSRRRKPSAHNLLREVESWRALSHPNVLPYTGITQTLMSTAPALVSPWMANGNLRDHLQAASNVNRLKTMELAARGMHFLHQNNVIHGNLHTANILIDTDGTPKVADFGLSEILSEFRGEDAGSLGQIRYQAPELILNEVPSPTKACDVFAFGTICYEALSGIQPYDHLVTDVDVVLAVHYGCTPYLQANKRSLVPPNIDRAFWELMLSCWSQAFDNRPEMGHISVELRNMQSLGADAPVQSHL